MGMMCGQRCRINNDDDDGKSENIDGEGEGWESSPPPCDAAQRNGGGLPQMGTNDGDGGAPEDEDA